MSAVRTGGCCRGIVAVVDAHACICLWMCYTERGLSFTVVPVSQTGTTVTYARLGLG